MSISHILSVKITATTAEFQSAIKKAERAFNKFDKDISKYAKATAVALTAATVAATAAMARFTAQGLKSADELAKSARALQMTNAEMRALQIFASESGVSVNTLAQSISKMSVELSKMASGQVSDRALRELGLDILAIQKMRPADQFNTITTALGKMADKNRQAALSAILLKDESGRLINAIRAGSVEFERAQELVAKYGLALNEADSANIEKLNDQISLLGFVAKAAKEQFASGVTPALRTFIEMTLEATGNTQKFAAAGKWAADVIVVGMHYASKAVMGLQTIIKGGELAMLAAMRTVAWATRQDLGVIDAVIADVRLEWDALREAMGKDPVLDWYAQILSLPDLLKKAGDNAVDAVTGIRWSLTELTNLVSSAASTIESSLTDAFMTGKLKAGDMIRAIIADIIKLIIRVMILRPLMGAIGGAMGGTGTALGSAFMSYASGGGKALGGPVAGGTSYLVGERGPEIFTPRGSGFVTPNHALGGGGATINIDARGADVAAVARLEQALAMVSSSIERRAVSAVGRRYSRNPGFLGA